MKIDLNVTYHPPNGLLKVCENYQKEISANTEKHEKVIL